MVVHTYPSISCPICRFGLKNESKVLSFQTLVNENENEEQIKAEIDLNDPDVQQLQKAGLLPKHLSNESLDNRIQEMLGDCDADEVIQAKLQELKNLLDEHIAKYVDDDETEETNWTQMMEWLREKFPDELDLLEWHLLNFRR